MQSPVKKGLIVDIDDTLSDTTKFWIGYFLEAFGNPENLDISGMYNKYHYVQNVPYWKSSYINKIIYKFTYSNRFQQTIPLITGANTHLKKIAENIPIKCYLTKRPEAVRSGTEFWMKRYNFPPAEIIFRPGEVSFDEGNNWKSAFIERVRDDVFGIIDDDEKLIRLIQRDRSMHLFLYGKPTLENPLLRVYPCLDWDILYNNILNLFTDNSCS